MSTYDEITHIYSDQWPVRLGFFLESHGVTCFNWPTIPYRGIDRLPHIPSPEEDDGLRSAGRGGLVDLWERYWNASDGEELRLNLSLAQELQQMFLGQRVELDIVYSEIAFIPGDLEAYPRGSLWLDNLTFVLSQIQGVHNRLLKRPDNLQLLGFDISLPVPSFHSAIYQPGLHRRHARLPDYLNRFGLFADLNTALRFLSMANEMDYGALPFCILGIWEPSSI